MVQKNNIEAPPAENIKNNPIVDEFLKTIIGERIKQTHAEKTDQNEKNPRYYKYDPRPKKSGPQNPYEAKRTYLNHIFQCDVGKLPAEQVEHLYKNSAPMRRAQRIHQGRAIESEVFHSDKLSPKEKLVKIRFLTLLNLPDIVPDYLLVITTPISGPDLRMYIKDMINAPDLLKHYNDLLSNWSSIFPETRIFHNPKMTVSNIIEKIKKIYKSFGASLTADDKRNASRSNYTINYPVWPKSDITDDPRWINCLNTSQGFYGGDDISVINEHSLLLKFHILFC
ncbi:hypothetical protein CHS0354_010425 [Potamilus streckersoni]|uniref:Uncharacterized protein n=1 Tax=Potamilus streckersoni TaxID=2493646 RepID=A0AAE0SLP0_9BIVA|nr:hypothetical protein CHS0354_010425 [Potamilus streckersoni]